MSPIFYKPTQLIIHTLYTHTFTYHTLNQASLNHTPLFIVLTVAGLHSALATPQLKLDVSLLFAYLRTRAPPSRPVTALRSTDGLLPAPQPPDKLPS